jgi:transposase
VSREIVTGCLVFIDALAPVIERLDGELSRHAKADPRVKVLTALPGVGQFTALVMLAEIGDITRFGSARKLASWAGLRREHGRRVRPGTSTAALKAANSPLVTDRQRPHMVMWLMDPCRRLLATGA